MTTRRQSHPCTACPECDDVQNECCPSCEGTDEYCPICRIPAKDCELQEGWDDEYQELGGGD